MPAPAPVSKSRPDAPKRKSTVKPATVRTVPIVRFPTVAEVPTPDVAPPDGPDAARVSVGPSDASVDRPYILAGLALSLSDFLTHDGERDARILIDALARMIDEHAAPSTSRHRKGTS